MCFINVYILESIIVATVDALSLTLASNYLMFHFPIIYPFKLSKYKDSSWMDFTKEITRNQLSII